SSGIGGRQDRASRGSKRRPRRRRSDARSCHGQRDGCAGPRAGAAPVGPWPSTGRPDTPTAPGARTRLTMMTPMSGALDWLAVGDIAEERGSEDQRILGGGAARLVAHAAALGARTALVAKVGDDQAGSRINEGLERLHVDLRWLRRAPGQRTTVWHDPDGEAAGRRVERGADLALRLDELPPVSAAAALVVVSGYSLSVEPARSAALGALTTARARGARAALWLDPQLLWWQNARITRRVLEPAIAAAESVALQEADAGVRFGPVCHAGEESGCRDVCSVSGC